ncbi:hypothetical protein EDD15DRAFT_1839876 [Pisolithus albus]|nr:hypothetical protein EDD15DRAFT_1839876 [Pisolithus albus]
MAKWPTFIRPCVCLCLWGRVEAFFEGLHLKNPDSAAQAQNLTSHCLETVLSGSVRAGFPYQTYTFPNAYWICWTQSLAMCYNW